MCGIEKLQRQDIITALAMDEKMEWCNSFVLVPKANGKVRLCLDQARLNLVLIRPVNRGPTFNEIFPKLNNVKYLSLIYVGFGYHNLKLDDRLSYLTTVTCQCGSTGTKDYHLEQHPQVTCSSIRLMRCLKICLMYLTLQKTF